MIYKLFSFLPIILVGACGIEVKETLSISTQSISRLDIPTSFTNAHNHKREIKSKALKRYPVIQYAPLNYVKIEDQYETQNRKPKETKSRPESVSTEHVLHRGHEKPKCDYLEPKPLSTSDNVSQQNHRSFVSGHNVEEYPETTEQYSEQSEDLFETQQNFYHNQKLKPQKFVYYQKYYENSILKEPTLQKIVVEPQPAKDEFKFLEYLPAVYNISPRKKHKHIKSVPYTFSLHSQPLQEKQQQAYAHSRIHLNIARSYNIAHQPPEKHLPPLYLAPKTLSLTSLLLTPHNTLMLPIRKGNSLLG